MRHERSVGPIARRGIPTAGMVILLQGFLCLATLPGGAAAEAGQAPEGNTVMRTGMSARRPNILWLVSEDNDTFLGCYGDPLAHTPTLDRLASQGVLFERCFAQPVCAPSRFALITGMHSVTCGPAEHMRAQGKIPSWLKGFPAYLRKAGYYTSNNAKTDYNSPINMKEAWDASNGNAHWRKRPDPQQPFFSVFNHEVTHESCLFPGVESKLDFPPMDPARVRIPPYQPDTPELPYVQRLTYQFQARGYQSWAREAAAGGLTPATAQFWGEKPTEELYDMVADPDNVHNLVSDPVHLGALEQMCAEMKRRVLAYKDNGFIPEGSPLEGYEASRAPGAVPFERVVDLANLASERRAENLPKLSAALDDSNEAVRWWGALGCAMLRNQAAPAEAGLRKRLEDPSGAVQAAAAEALAHLGHADLALPVLERWITDTSGTFYTVHAANVLIRLGEAGRPLLPVMKKMYSATKDAAMNTAPYYLNRLLERNIGLLEGREPALVYPRFEGGK